MAASALSKLKRFPGFAVLLTYIFVVSGVIVGGLSILLLVIWPFSKNLYRRVVSLLLATLSGREYCCGVCLTTSACTGGGSCDVVFLCCRVCVDSQGLGRYGDDVVWRGGGFQAVW